MRIGVLSPVAHGTGASCISLLLALRLGQSSTERVCLTHVHPTDSTLREISGVADTIDKTTTPSMIISTFKSSTAMTEQEYTQYCASVTREVDLFTCTRSGDLMSSYEDARYLSNYVMDKFPHKHVVVDADEHSEAAMLDVIERSDVVVFVTRVSKSNIEMLKIKLGKYSSQGVLSGKKVMVVFNQHHPNVATQKELAKAFGTLVKAVYYIPMSHYIAWGAYNRKIQELWSFITKSDPRVADIRIELDRMAANILQKGKTAKEIKKETGSLFGVKLRTESALDKNVGSGAVVVTPASKEHAESMHLVNNPQQRQAQVQDTSGLHAGFGAPAQSGFITQELNKQEKAPELNKQEKAPVGVLEREKVPVQANTREGTKEQASTPIAPIRKPVLSEAPPSLIPNTVPKPVPKKEQKTEISGTQPHKVIPSPVEFATPVSDPLNSVRPAFKTPVPNAILKPKVAQAVLPGTTLGSVIKPVTSKAIKLPEGGLQTKTIGQAGGVSK